MNHKLCLAILGTILFFSTVALAQVNTGQISGTITDSSGAVIPGADVVITNQAAKLTWSTAAAASGFYVVANLPAGSYNVALAISPRSFTAETLATN